MWESAFILSAAFGVTFACFRGDTNDHRRPILRDHLHVSITGSEDAHYIDLRNRTALEPLRSGIQISAKCVCGAFTRSSSRFVEAIIR